MALTPPSTGYVIARNTTSDAYTMFRFDPNGTDVLVPVALDPNASYDRRHSLVWIGGYFLGWSPAQPSMGAPYFNFRLVPFNPASRDPLSAPPLQHGQWTKRKFWGALPDFGNPLGSRSQFETGDELQLVPLGTFLLNFIPTLGRGTYGLWNFDPCVTAPGTVDPIPGPYSFTPQGAFRDMQLGDELISMNGYVLDRKPATGEYRLWSFDPQARNPLAHPAIQQGRWSTIDIGHQLVPIGDYVLDWVPADRSYRLWRFDPCSADPLTGPVRTGTLPGPITADSRLLGFEPNVVPDATVATANVPGTIEFMRTRIKHVVCYMLENRSFDHVCGWLYNQDDAGIRVIGPEGPYKGASPDLYNLDGDTKVPLTVYQDGKLSTDYPLELFTFDPYHDLSDVLRQLFFKNANGYVEKAVPDMGGFVLNNGSRQVMQTYSPEQLPVLNGLARHFAISDEWFCAIPASTDSNRAFALTGSAMMELSNFMSPPQYLYWPEQPHRPSIFKLLWTNGFNSWRIYNSTLWTDHVFTYQLFLQGQIPTVDADVNAGIGTYVAPIDQFYDEALSGQLPAFSYLEPIWIGNSGTTSYHPGEDLVPAEVQLNKVYDSLRKGPNWNETLLIITFDEHGGIFDHVPPPRAVNPWPNDVNDGFHYDLMGPRVPTILVSPLIEPNTVFRATGEVSYDATSFMATLLHWFGIPKSRWFMGERARQAPTFEGVLTRSTARTDAPTLTPPYDKSYPPDGIGTPSSVVHDLQRQIAHQMIVWMASGKLTPTEISTLSHEIITQSTDIATLMTRLQELQKRFG
jgi:phospholipase C